jgi:hypothetical protein
MAKSGTEKQYFFELGADAYKQITVTVEDLVCRFEAVEYDGLGIKRNSCVYDLRTEDVGQVTERGTGVEILTREGKIVRI